MLMKNILVVFGFLIVSTSVSGCANTIDGAGRDISKAGEAIQKTF